MEFGALIGLYVILFPFLVIISVGYWKLFQKAGRPGWEAIIPLYSYYVMLKISGRPAWWLIWLFVPIVNVIIVIGVYTDFIASYGKTTFGEKIKGILLPIIFIPKWGFDKNTTYHNLSIADLSNHKRSVFLEWSQAFIIFVLPAIIIRTFFVETYTIPTPSMERSLLVGDCFLASKLSYGPRIPMTPVAYPFENHTIQLLNAKAYWDGWKLGYHRLPGFGEVKKGDVVVFNFPMDADLPLYRPVDKRENYIKRCQGTPGDTLRVVQAQVYINSKMLPNPPESQIDYLLTTTGMDLNPQVMQDLHISMYDGALDPTMTVATYKVLQAYSNVKPIKPNIKKAGEFDQVYPNSPDHPAVTSNLLLPGRQHDFKWNVDNYGPIIIPKKGWTVKLDTVTYPLYARCISVYENNKVQIVGNDIIINGKKTDSYTFKMNYYWMMGDNRHDTYDSRYWGFLPEDHVIGKAIFIWMSWDETASFFNKIRWSRLFKIIH